MLSFHKVRQFGQVLSHLGEVRQQLVGGMALFKVVLTGSSTICVLVSHVLVLLPAFSLKNLQFCDLQARQHTFALTN